MQEFFDTMFLIYLLLHFLNSIDHGASLLIENNYSDKLLELKQGFKNECLSDVCQKEATFFRNIINPDIDPCEDFYQFACGNFIKSTTIPKNEKHVSVLSSVQENINTQIINDIKEINENDIEIFKKVKQFYQNCLKNPGEEATNSLLDIINKFGGMPVLSDNMWNETKFNWLTTVSKLTNYGLPLHFPVNLDSNALAPTNSGKAVLLIDNPPTHVDEMFFSNESNAKQIYFEYMVDVVVMLGANRNVAIKEMENCLDFEMKLYEIQSPWDESDNISSYMTIEELTQRNPSIPWLDLIRKIYEPFGNTVDKNELIYVGDLPAIDKLEQLIAITPKRTIANYIFSKQIFDLVDYLSDDFLNRQSQFKGIEKKTDKLKKCKKETITSLPVAISALYVRKHYTKEDRKNAMELVQNVKKGFQKMIQEAQWLDNVTKNAALDKLQAMEAYVGIFDEFFDDSKLNEHYRDVEINDEAYLRTALNVNRFYNKIFHRKLGKVGNTKEWFHLTGFGVLINAYYQFPTNHLEIPASLLQPPIFHAERPQYLNYGNLGTTIGHEITHGFDTEGRLRDKDGNKINWWSNATEQTYVEKTKCFVDQYNNYTIEQLGRKLNGELTLIENIADIGGLKAAYNAYIEWTKRNNIEEPRLPGLSYSPRQMFWISAANFYCSKSSTEHLQLLMKNMYSPDEARMNVPARNYAKFAEDFGCKPGSNMNPVKKCDLW